MVNTLITTLLLALLSVSVAESARTKLNTTNDETSICKSLVESQGYTCQEHKVTTKDGYILGLQRIPVGRSGKTADKSPVLLQHGLFMDAATWLFNSPDESLAFILADNGFDVWLGNTRGTMSSRGHNSLSPSDLELYLLGLRELVPEGQQFGKILKLICGQPVIDCSNLMSAFTGPNCCLNISRTNIFLDHEIQSTATKNLIHLAQMIRSGKVAMHDYGYGYNNMKQYGQPTPPIYNMSNIPIDVPLFLSYGGKDALSDVDDVHILLEDLKDHDGDKLVAQFIDDYAHMDFVVGVNANTVVYKPLLAFFEQH